MKQIAMATAAVLTLTIIAGCLGAGGVQGVLDTQCNAMVSGDVDAFLGTFEASVTNPEWVEMGKPMTEMMFSMAEIEKCTSKVISQETGEDGVIKAEVETTMKITAFGQSTEKAQTTTRYFVEIDGKMYERGTVGGMPVE